MTSSRSIGREAPGRDGEQAQTIRLVSDLSKTAHGTLEGIIQNMR